MSSANSNTSSFEQDVVVLDLNFHKPGMQKRVKAGALDIGSTNIDPKRLAVSKFIYKTDELQEIKRFFDRIKYYVQTKAIPVDTAKDARFLILSEEILEVIQQLDNFQPELKPLIDNLRAAYPGIVAGAQQELGDLFDPADFPDFDDVAQSISFDWEIPDLYDSYAKLGRLSFERLQAERKKLDAHNTRLKAELELALCMKLHELFETVAKDLAATTKKSKPKTISQTKLEKYEADIKHILSRNITGHAEIKQLALQCRTLLTTGTPDDLNFNAQYRGIVAAGIEKLTIELAGLNIIPQQEENINVAA